MSSLSSGNTLLASDKSDKSIKPKDAASEKSSLAAPTAAVRSMFGVRAKKVAIKKEVVQSAAEAIVICIE
jgi:hypothetical protein